MKEANGIKTIELNNEYLIRYIEKLSAYYGANCIDFAVYKELFQKIDELKFEEKQTYIQVNETELRDLRNICNQILGESWDEWSIITGTSLEELKEFRDYLEKEYLYK